MQCKTLFPLPWRKGGSYESKYNNIGETNHYIYTVKRGDTLSGISRKFRINLRNIIKINNIKNPNLIYAGERLRVEIK